MFTAQSGLVRDAKFVRKEEINLSNRPRCVISFITPAKYASCFDVIVLGTMRNLMECDDHVSKH